MKKKLYQHNGEVKKMPISMNQAEDLSRADQLIVSVSLDPCQFQLISMLNQFAIHQAQYNPEVRQFPAKMMYKVNDELKLAFVALLTTCSLLDPKRRGNEAQEFFEHEIKIIQTKDGIKTIDFGSIRPELVQNSLIPEVVNDWILYRDVNGDGIHALMDRKTYLQGLKDYQKGGDPVYEFARFYRCFMKDKLAKQQRQQERVQDMAIKSLLDQTIQQQLAHGTSPQALLDNLMHNDIGAALTYDADSEPVKALPKK